MADKGFHHVPIESLVVTAAGMGRYAGGSRYKMTPRMKALAERIKQQAEQLIRPAFVFAAHNTEKLEDRYRDILRFTRKKENIAGLLPYISVCVCTLGPELEKTVGVFSGLGQAIEAMFLDAAGVAYLEALADFALKFSHDEAKKRSFYPGCRLGPGFGDIPLTIQKQLFELVDTAPIGVRLKSSSVMVPAKSVSFWVSWSDKPPVAGTGAGYKCRDCDLKDCLYRVGGRE